MLVGECRQQVVGSLRRLVAVEGEAGAVGPVVDADAQLVAAGVEREDLAGVPAVELLAGLGIGDDEPVALEAADHVAHHGDQSVLVAGGEFHQ